MDFLFITSLGTRQLNGIRVAAWQRVIDHPSSSKAIGLKCNDAYKVLGDPLFSRGHCLG